MKKRKHHFWKDRDQPYGYRLIQWSLDMCGWNTTHYRSVKIDRRYYSLPVGGPVPACRMVVGPPPSEEGIVSFAISTDCGKCDSCTLPKHLRLIGATHSDCFKELRKA